MNLSEHFTLEDFVKSDIAARNSIDNTLPEDLLNDAKALAGMLERIRAKLSTQLGKEVPMIESSGYRCLELNRKVGSQDSSSHILAGALDFKAPDFGSPYAICMFLKDHVEELGIQQLIYEYESWVHVGNKPVAHPINRIITVDRDGTHVGIVERNLTGEDHGV